MALSRRKKIIIGVSAVVLLIAIILISVFASRKDVPEATVVKIEPRSELKSTVTASGEIRPIQFINLTSEVQGRIEEIYVKAGDVVTKGQPLVRLDPDQLQSSTDAQVAAYQAAQNDTQVSRSQIIAAQNQLSQTQQGLNASQASVDTARQQVISARQQVIAAQSDVDREQKNLSIAQRELKRTTELLESGVASRIEFDEAKDRVDQAEIALRNARSRLTTQENAVVISEKQVSEQLARLKQQEVAVKDARRQVETATLTAQTTVKRAEQQGAVLRGQENQRDKTLQIAPINGVIADIPSKVGTFAVAGLSTTALLTIADMSTIIVEVKVDETEIDKVAVGQSTKIKVDAFGEKELNGKVIVKDPLAIGKSQTTGGLSQNININEAKEFKVTVELIDIPDEIRSGLRPGMSATATITTNTVQNVVTVPLQALVEKQPESPSPTPEGMKNDLATSTEKPKPLKGVYILEDGNKAKFVEVVTGITGESDIEIKSGLSADQEVITGPSRVLKTLKDGDVIKRQVKKDGDAPKK